MDSNIKNIDFSKLGFNYIKTDYSYISYYRNGKWDQGELTQSDRITISAASPAIHYAQQAFEGLKAYRTKEGKIILFRPDENAKRLMRTCERLLMPEIPIENFIEAVKLVVKANEKYVPPYDTKSTLYIRPYIIGIGDNLGVRAANEYIFGILCSPVGPYFQGGITPVNFLITDYDRAAPHGTGDIKVGGNYAASLYPNKLARAQGYVDCIYLDPATHTKVEEVGAANFFGITHDNRFVTPASSSILPSITKFSLMHIAKEYLNMIVEERDIYVSKFDELKEAGACGTAAVISPIGGVKYKDKFHVFYSETEVGPITKELYNILSKIQFGDIDAPTGWIYPID